MAYLDNLLALLGVVRKVLLTPALLLACALEGEAEVVGDGLVLVVLVVIVKLLVVRAANVVLFIMLEVSCNF